MMESSSTVEDSEIKTLVKMFKAKGVTFVGPISPNNSSRSLLVVVKGKLRINSLLMIRHVYKLSSRSGRAPVILLKFSRS